MEDSLLHTIRRLNRGIALLTGLLLMACAAIVLADIVLRQMGSSFGGTDEISGYVMAIATSWGEVLGARRIYFGAMEEDSSGYPDCRGVFIEAFDRVIAAGTRPETDMHVEAPLLTLTKADVVRLGVELGAPLHLSWSCYCTGDVACGQCDSCLLRLRGFHEAGIQDPIAYATGTGD